MAMELCWPSARKISGVRGLLQREVGSGVTGLSIALELHSRGVKVAVVARDIAEDSDSVGFASPWAGCNWFSFANGLSDPAAKWDRITYMGLEKLAKERPDLCEKVPIWDVFERPKKADEKPWYANLVTDYTEITPSSQIPLPGLGARSLIGVEDNKVYPAIGQTVLVKAPSVRECYFHVETFFPSSEDSERRNEAPPQAAYMIPRPGPEGHVVVGGHYRVGDWSTDADIKEAERILQDCYKLCPKLAGPDGRSWKDIEVVAHNVGLRPAREGGARLELEKRQIGKVGSTQLAPGNIRNSLGRMVAVLHAYGMGGAGFQNSLGVAEKAADLAVSHLTHNNPNRAKL
ncbi:hypothetical protein V865_006344 [Kwoniella europaea PYCC6329]|uniref:D-amino-acid oxidase n=1 Tax=Kwoniella europaea PYCC6329 TaxID=1423913 RepID=A0AAX4KPW6_9TREE